MRKLNVLFIAKNIPTPKNKTNRIIFDIAQNLSDFCKINFLFPKEIVPFWLKNKPKFKHLYRLKNWNFEGFSITPILYWAIPIKSMQFWAMFFMPLPLKKHIKRNGAPDLVHAHYLLPDGYMAYKLYTRYNIPYLITFRNSDKKYLSSISENNPDFRKARKIISSAQKILVTNKAYKDFVKVKFGIDSTIIPHGINASIFSNVEQQGKSKELVITTVAEAIPRKNIDWILKAFLNYTGNAKIKLNIVGDGPQLKQLKLLAANDKRITFWGRISHEKVLEILRISDIFSLPSYNETFGMVYLEAAATQNAILGMKEEGVWGVFEENTEMLFCRDFEQFQKKLHLLIDNEKTRNRLIQNAFEKAKILSWTNITKAYKEIYLKIFNNE